MTILVTNKILLLTRSIEVICSSQYLQSNLDRVQMLKPSNNLITISLYRDSKIARARDGKYCAVPGGPPGLFPTPLPGQSTGGVRRVTQTTSIAVPLGVIPCHFQIIDLSNF
jgi:hypothetical protein